MARSTPAQPHDAAQGVDIQDQSVRMDATNARSGSKDRDVFVVLMISTILAVLAMIGAFAYYSGSLAGFGNQARSTSTFERPNETAPAAKPASQTDSTQIQ